MAADRSHEFQAKFHWHVEDKGIRHVHIKARSPQLNGKVERSHRTNKAEFYQLLYYIDDIELNKKLAEWEHFYNFNRLHDAFEGQTPYEVLRERLQQLDINVWLDRSYHSLGIFDMCHSGLRFDRRCARVLPLA